MGASVPNHIPLSGLCIRQAFRSLASLQAASVEVYLSFAMHNIVPQGTKRRTETTACCDSPRASDDGLRRTHLRQTRQDATEAEQGWRRACRV